MSEENSRKTSTSSGADAAFRAKDRIYCLECGEGHVLLRRHLRNAHGLTPSEYRARWNLPEDHPLTAEWYSRSRKAVRESRAGMLPVPWTAGPDGADPAPRSAENPARALGSGASLARRISARADPVEIPAVLPKVRVPSQ